MKRLGARRRDDAQIRTVPPARPVHGGEPGRQTVRGASGETAVLTPSDTWNGSLAVRREFPPPDAPDHPGPRTWAFRDNRVLAPGSPSRSGSDAPEQRAPPRYPAFSELAGPLQAPPVDNRVRFRPVTRGAARLRAWLLISAALVFEALFLLWLLRPVHYPEFTGDWRSYLGVGLIGSVGGVEGPRPGEGFTPFGGTLYARGPHSDG